MTLADAWPAQKPLYLRTYLDRVRTDRRHQFVGSLMVPKRLSDGRYPVVDVWTRTMEEVVITPFMVEPKKMPKIFIGASEFGNTINVKWQHLMRIDTVRGVEPAGYGFGFILYAATALSAKFTGPEGIYSVPNDRSIEASELWSRLKQLSFHWTAGPLGKTTTIAGAPFRSPSNIDYILGQSVLDSGLVTRVGEKYGRQWASFRKPPTDNFAYDLKYKAKKLSAWERSAIATDSRYHVSCFKLTFKCYKIYKS